MKDDNEKNFKKSWCQHQNKSFGYWNKLGKKMMGRPIHNRTKLYQVINKTYETERSKDNTKQHSKQCFSQCCTGAHRGIITSAIQLKTVTCWSYVLFSIDSARAWTWHIKRYSLLLLYYKQHPSNLIWHFWEVLMKKLELELEIIFLWTKVGLKMC